MVPNLIATFIGIWLSYAAVLDFSRVETSRWLVYAAAAAVIALAWWSRRRDFAKWPGTSSMAASLALIAAIGMGQFGLLSHLALFWVVFFSGNVVAVLSFWAAIYRPKQMAAPQA